MKVIRNNGSELERRNKPDIIVTNTTIKITRILGFSVGKLIGRRAFEEGNKEKGKLVYQDSQLSKDKAID